MPETTPSTLEADVAATEASGHDLLFPSLPYSLIQRAGAATGDTAP